jgi:nucleotide-binding universal stress UspA family protein
MIKSILLAIDGSNYTESILKYGVDLANKFDAHLRVLTVIDIRIFEWAVAIGVEGFAPIIPSTAYQEESQRLLEEKADKLLERTSEVLKEAKVSFEIEKTSGSPVEIICDKCRLADLIVMGCRGEFGPWRDKMLGATLEATSRLAIKPILVTQKEYSKISHILFAYDGSINSNKAFPWVGAFAKQFEAKLTILIVSSEEESAKGILKDSTNYLSNYDLSEINTMIKEGDAETKIVEAAKEVNADLIIMGSYGHSRIREAILGSTTVHVMRHARAPILMVK